MLLCFLFFFAIADVLDLPIHKAETFICLEIDEDNHFQDAIDKEIINVENLVPIWISPDWKYKLERVDKLPVLHFSIWTGNRIRSKEACIGLKNAYETMRKKSQKKQ